MARKPDRKGLGRGLSALLGDDGDQMVSTASGAAPARIPIDLVHANPNQPRRRFDDRDLEDLAQSLRERGIIQPVLLRPDPARKGHYQIVAGERRWRAAQRAGLHDLPAVVRELDDRQVLELAIIENVQRVDLNPVEEASGYAQLVETFDYTQEQLATVIGKSRSHLANTMRLLALPPAVLALVRDGSLTAGHARALVSADNPAAMAQQVVKQGLNVRQTEALVRKPAAGATRSGPKKPEKDADTRVLEGDLTATIGMRVQIEHDTTRGGGEMRIRYKTLDDLDRLCAKLAE